MRNIIRLAVTLLVIIILGGYIYHTYGGGNKSSSSALLINNVETIGEVNVYTSRKEELLKPLFDQFTKIHKIKVNSLYDKAPKLIARLEQEKQYTLGDVFLTADIANLELARKKGLLRWERSEILDTTLPQSLIGNDHAWYGLSYRVRPIFYAKDRVKPEELSTYQDLANEKWRGRILIRSSKNVYNQSLIASIVDEVGGEEAFKWMSGFVANFARTPQGGDTDQLRALAAGEGDIAIANSYYYARLLTSANPADRQAAENIGIFFPNQRALGAHTNISGGGVIAFAKNGDNARLLLEYLVSEKAQALYARLNHEYPVVETVELSQVLSQWGQFKMDKDRIKEYVSFAEQAQRMADELGWR